VGTSGGTFFDLFVEGLPITSKEEDKNDENRTDDFSELVHICIGIKLFSTYSILYLAH